MPSRGHLVAAAIVRRPTENAPHSVSATGRSGEARGDQERHCRPGRGSGSHLGQLWARRHLGQQSQAADSQHEGGAHACSRMVSPAGRPLLGHPTRPAGPQGHPASSRRHLGPGPVWTPPTPPADPSQERQGRPACRDLHPSSSWPPAVDGLHTRHSCGRLRRMRTSSPLGQRPGPTRRRARSLKTAGRSAADGAGFGPMAPGPSTNPGTIPHPARFRPQPRAPNPTTTPGTVR